MPRCPSAVRGRLSAQAGVRTGSGLAGVPPSPKATLENPDLRWLFCASSRLALGFSATVSLVPLRRGCYGMSGFYEMSRYFGFSLKPLFWGKRLSPWILFPVSQAEKPSRCSLGKISFLPQRGSLGR